MAKNDHPGKILAEEYMKPLELSANGLARELDVPPNRISSIINGSRSITADTALRLARYFRTTPEHWLNIQNAYELAVAREENGKAIQAKVQPGPKIGE
ncbi:HigA family addiction module antitoxin [Bradyrhizobium sp. USDA 4508]